MPNYRAARILFNKILGSKNRSKSRRHFQYGTRASNLEGSLLFFSLHFELGLTSRKMPFRTRSMASHDRGAPGRQFARDNIGVGGSQKPMRGMMDEIDAAQFPYELIDIQLVAQASKRDCPHNTLHAHMAPRSFHLERESLRKRARLFRTAIAPHAENSVHFELELVER